MIEFRVSGMSCGGCVASVTRAIQAVDSAARVTADLQAQQVLVETTAGMDRLRAAIEGAGYDVLESKQKS